MPSSNIKKSKKHNGDTYGGKMYFRRIVFQFFVEHFNGGEYFIDTYFDSVYPYTVKSIVDEKAFL